MKYSEIKGLPVADFLKVMQDTVKGNTERLKANNVKVDSIINQEAKSKNRDEKLDAIFKENRSITEENNGIIELHNKVVRFMKDKHNTDKEESSMNEKSIQDFNKKITEAKAIDKDQIFDDTVNGKVDFNKYHPMYNDTEFKSMLFDYYIDNEEYEKCEALKNS